MNFAQHWDVGRSSWVRSIFGSMSGANSVLAQHNHSPEGSEMLSFLFEGQNYKTNMDPL